MKISKLIECLKNMRDVHGELDTFVMQELKLPQRDPRPSAMVQMESPVIDVASTNKQCILLGQELD